jgi:hypothetical protein
LKREGGLFFLLFGLILFSLLTCGKKAPPFLPERSLPLEVRELTGERENGIVRLTGNFVSLKGGEGDISDLAGCRIYLARYDLDHPPCESCAIKYKMREEVRGPVVEEGKFRCQVSGIDKKGIYFFKVRLLGQEGVQGPFSDSVKLVVE